MSYFCQKYGFDMLKVPKDVKILTEAVVVKSFRFYSLFLWLQKSDIRGNSYEDIPNEANEQ